MKNEERLIVALREIMVASDPISPDGASNYQWAKFDEAIQHATMVLLEVDPYPITDWRYEVANGDTTLGYREWCEHKLEADNHEN